VHDRTGQRAGNTVDHLNLRHHKLAEIVNVGGLGAHDHVIRARDIFGLGDARDLPDPHGNVGCLADLRLDEDVGLDHDVLPGGGYTTVTTIRKRHATVDAPDAGGRATAGFLGRAGPGGLHGPTRPCGIGAVLEAHITIGELGEFGLITRMAAAVPQGSQVVVGIGDDAAVLRVPDGRVVATTDMLVEGRHFRRDWSGPADVGHKAAMRSIADVAAMGAARAVLLVAFAAPPDLPVSWADEFTAGLAAECARGGAVVAGGDIAAAGSIMITVTALGDLEGRSPVTRAGARSGDVVAVAGRLGHSAAGLALLQRGLAHPAELIEGHRRPRPPYEAGPEAALLGATAMIDVSDGLLADLGHVAAASGVLIDVTTALLPVGRLLAEAAEMIITAAAGEPAQPDGAGAPGENRSGAAAAPLAWVLAGGEDHALAATFPAGTELPARWSVIGRVRPAETMTTTAVAVDGKRYDGVPGWDHFG
jgi:thiamine-monophosphate kinase